MKKLQLVSIAAAAVACAGPALAQQSPLYLGGGIGVAQHSIDTGNVSRQLVDLGFLGATTSASKDESAYKLSAGWQAHSNVAVEVSYFDLGKPDFNASSTRPGTFAAKLKVTGWSVDVVPQYQFANGIGLLGRLGYARTETKTDFSGTGVFRLIESSTKERRNTWDAGAGVSYAINKNLSLRAEWTYFPDIGGDAVGGKYSANMYTVSGFWRF